MTKKMYIMMILCLTLCLIFGLDSYASSSSEIENYYNEYGSSYDSGLMAPNVYSSENFVDVSRGDVIISEKDFVIKGRNGFDIPIIRKYNPNYKLGIVREGDSLTANNIPQSYGYYYYNTTTNDRILIGFANEFDAFKYRNGFAGYNHADFRPDTSTNAQYYFIDSIYCEDGECEYERDTSSDMVIIYTTYYRELYIEETDYGDQYISLDSNWVVLKPGMFMWDFWVDSPNYEYVYTFQDIYGNVISSYITYRKVNGIFIPTVGLCYDQHRDYSFSFVDSNNMEITATHPKGFSYNFVIESGDGIKYYFYASTYNNFALKAFEDRYGNCFLYNITSGFAQSYTYTDCNTGIVYEVSQNGITKTLNNNSVDLVAYNYIRTNSTSDTTNDYGCDDKISLTVIKNDNEDADISQSVNRVTYNITQRIASDILYQPQTPSSDEYMRIHYGIDSIQYPNGLKKLYDYDAINTYRYYPSYARDVYGGYIYNKAEFTFETEFDRYSQTYNVTDTVVFFPYTSKKENYSFDEYGRKVSYKISGSGTYYLYNYSYSCRCYDVPSYHIREKNYVNYTNPTLSTEYDLNEHHLPTLKYIAGELDSTYTYGAYNIPTQIIQRKDDNTDIKTVNTLTSDGKSIASTAVYENNVLKNKKVYTYNSDGTLATETTHTSANESSTTSYTYAYGTDGSTTVTATTSGITDADGNAQDNIVTQTKTDSYGNIVWTKDANGNETTADYDLLGRVTQITNADNTFVTYAYNDTANTTTYTDAEGNTYRATYNGWGDVLKIYYLDNGTYKLLEEYAYNTENLLRMYKRFRDGTSRDVAIYTYDAFGRVLTETVKNLDVTVIRSVSYSYTDLADSQQRPIMKKTTYIKDGSTTKLTLESTTDYLGNEVTQKYTDSSGNVRQFTYTYDYLGNMLTSTAPDNSTESYTYNHLGNVLSYTNQLGNTQSVSYDMANQKVSETDFNGNTTTYVYDKAGRNIKIVNPFDDTQTSTKKLYYDSNGNLIQEQNQISATLYNKVDYDYDVMNRLAFVATHENGAKTDLTQYFYDGNGNVTYMIIPHITIPRSAPEYMSPEDKYVSYTYDALGRCIATGGNLSVPKSYEYDFAGHMTKETKPMGSVAYTYDAFDRVTSVSDATSTTPKNTYTYNVLGQRTSMTDETGTTTYAYDGFGNLTTETKGGIIKTSTYNTMGRRTGFIVKNNGTTILSNSYTYDNAGRLLSVTSNGKTMSYTYDANGNVLSENGTDIQTSYAYNKANLVTEKTDTKSGNIIDKSYNIQYNLMGNRTHVTDLTNNYTDRYNYTQDGRLIYELKEGGNNIRTEISYDYDSVGNMTNRCVYYPDSNEVYDYSFVYGDYNQLNYANVYYDNYTDVVNYTIDYTYDTNGNIASKTEYTPENTIYKAYTYTFDIFDRMTQSTNDGIATTYTYDGDNLRATKTTNGVTTNHILDGMNVVADIIGSTTNSYSRGLSLYASKKGTQTFSYTTNIHGDISTEIDSQNAIKRDYYDNYGNIITEQITDMPFGYTGEYSDTETGLIYLRNRYYDPEICRFISEDPIMDGTNWYSYCDGNPVMFVDPWGLTGTPRGEEVYLRDMFNMYKKSSNDKISVYDNRVVVNLNSKSQTYYYNTNTHDSVHGNRMNNNKMVVNAVDFAEHFGFVKKEIKHASNPEFFSIFNDDVIGFVNGTATISYNFSVSYVCTPNKKIITEQSMYVSVNYWAYGAIYDAPAIIFNNTVTYTQGDIQKQVTLNEDYTVLKSGQENNLYNRKSTKNIVFSGDNIVGYVKFTILQGEAIKPGRHYDLYLNF